MTTASLSLHCGATIVLTLSGDSENRIEFNIVAPDRPLPSCIDLLPFEADMLSEFLRMMERQS